MSIKLNIWLMAQHLYMGKGTEFITPLFTLDTSAPIFIYRTCFRFYPALVQLTNETGHHLERYTFLHACILTYPAFLQ